MSNAKEWEQLVTDDVIEPAPSEDARKIDEAHKVVRGAIGKPQEMLARAYLAAVVAGIKAKAVKP